MAFWTKKPDVDAVGAEKAPAKEGLDLFVPHVKQESKGLFDRKTEAVVDVNTALERFGKVRSALGSGTVIQGKLTFDTPVRIDGKLAGEIFSSATLIVGPSGTIDANVEVASLVVLGSVKGTIKAAERVEVFSAGSIEGSLTTPVLVLEKGCVLNAECQMPQKAEKPTESPKANEVAAYGAAKFDSAGYAAAAARADSSDKIDEKAKAKNGKPLNLSK